MKWKEFLKPSKGKVVLAFLIFIFLPVFAYQVQILCEMTMEPGGHCPPETGFISLVGIAFVGTESMKYLDALTILLIPLGIIVSYFISSYKIRKVSSITPEDKASFREFLKITRGKLVIFSLGSISIIYVALGFIVTGMYGGTARSPPVLYAIHSLFGTIAMIIFPVSIFICWVLLSANIALIYLFASFSGFAYSLHGGISTLFGYISPGVAVLALLLLIIEWYLVSCLIIWGYRKWKSRK